LTGKGKKTWQENPNLEDIKIAKDLADAVNSGLIQNW